MLPRLVFATVVLASGVACCGFPLSPEPASGPPAGTPRYVVSASTLKLRASPSTSAETLVEVPHGDVVIVTGASTGSEVASGIRGGWAPVWYAGHAGYAFDGFLLTVPPPPATCGNLGDWARAIGSTGPEVSIEKKSCADMGIDGMEICDETKQTPLNAQATLITNAGYEWGSDTIRIPNATADQVWAAARQCFGGSPNFSGESLPTVAGPSPTVRSEDGEVSMIVDGAVRGWEYPQGCSAFVHVTQAGMDAEVSAGGGC